MVETLTSILFTQDLDNCELSLPLNETRVLQAALARPVHGRPAEPVNLVGNVGDVSRPLAQLE